MVSLSDDKAQEILDNMDVQQEPVDSKTNEKIRDLVTLTRGAYLLAKQLQDLAEDDPMVSDYYPLTFASAEAKKHAERIFTSRCMPET